MTFSSNAFPDAPHPPGRLLDARLHLLDRQLLDAEGTPVGIVDDLEVEGTDVAAVASGDHAPKVTGLVTGRALFTRIFGGQPPRSRLQTIGFDHVAKIGTVVQLRPTGPTVDGHWVEHWLRERVLRHIPGGRDAAQ